MPPLIACSYVPFTITVPAVVSVPQLFRYPFTVKLEAAAVFTVPPERIENVVADPIVNELDALMLTVPVDAVAVPNEIEAAFIVRGLLILNVEAEPEKTILEFKVLVVPF